MVTDTLQPNGQTSARLDLQRQQSLALPLILLLLGVALRLLQAACRFLNADEALHYLLSVQPSFGAAYRASLSTVHPPLLILFLHLWGMFGRSEIFLRLPSVAAGAAFCWIVFSWARRVFDDSTALITLLLSLFSPALILLSAEIRQYSLLLLFASGALYCLEAAIQERSAGLMTLFAISLWLALLTHYSALIFTLVLGLYAIVRFISSRSRVALVAPWILGQLGALALIFFLFVPHARLIKARGAPEAIAESYLRRSVFQPGEDSLVPFVARALFRLFHYFFSQAAVGAVALLLFLIGVALVFRGKNSNGASRPSGWELAILLCSPLLLNCALALIRLYPFGGTRHDSYLSIFILPLVGLAIARSNAKPSIAKPLLLGIVLLVCNLFPSPLGEYIHFRDQRRALMIRSVRTLNALPAGSALFTDDQGGLLLSYYLCHGEKVVQIERPYQSFLRAHCGTRDIISIDPRPWIFKADTFASTFGDMARTYDLDSSAEVWIYQAGWFIDKELALKDELKNFGCSAPQNYGHNIFLCRLQVPAS